jgi:transposase
VTRDSLPVAVTIGSAREHEGRRLIPLMESIRIANATGRPRKRPETVYADTKYAMPLNRFYLAKKRIGYQIPSRERRMKPGRPKRLDRVMYHRVRYTVERFFAWVKAFRRIMIRYERVSAVYSGFVHLACITLHLRILK